MGLFNNRVKRSEIKPGDHIYTYRALLAYSHHGIFVGENKVVHFTPDRDSNSRTLISSDSSFYRSSLTCSSYPECGFRQPNSGVVRSCLDCFLGNGSLYRFEYGVSRVVFLAHGWGGTCSTAKSDPLGAAMHRALYLLRSGFGNYDVVRNNCEDFALYCKTGLRVVSNNIGTSGQVCSVSSVIVAPLAAILSSPLTLLVPYSIGTTTLMSGIYSYGMNRIATDIGVRTDVSKVPVEDLAVSLGWEGHHEEVDDDSEVVAMHSVSIPILDGTNFSDWSEQVQFYLGIRDLDLALRTEKPPAITNSSNAEEKALYNSWERSNRLSIMFMQINIANNIKSTLPECDSAKEFFKVVEERFRSDEKCLTGTLMAKLTAMKFDGTREMHEHIIEMTNLVVQLKALGINVDEFFLMRFILNSLPPQYGSFQIQYNTIKDKWNVNELTSMLVQEEVRLKQQGHHSVHLLNQRAKNIELLEVNGPSQVIEVHEKRQNNVIQSLEVNGPPQVIEAHEKIQNNVIQPPEVSGPPQVIEVHEKRQNNVIQPPEVNGSPQVIKDHEKRQNNVQCHLCRKFGHVQKNCNKHLVHLVSQGAKKIESHEVNGPPQVIEVHEKRQNNVQCHFCKNFGHVKKNCHKRRALFKKKGLRYNPNHKAI